MFENPFLQSACPTLWEIRPKIRLAEMLQVIFVRIQKELTRVPLYGKVKISNICRTVRRGSFPEKITEENEGKSVDNLENL